MHIQKNAPKFIGIGGKGSGLAIVTELLQVHPGVQSPIPSVGFFNAPAFQDEDLTEYVTALCLKPESLLCGESCPDYLTAPHVAERIAKTYPDAKLFVVVRNPIDRAIMLYEHARAKHLLKTPMTCAQYLANYPHVQTDGFYGQHLLRYFALYTTLQLQIIVYEDFVRDPLKVMQQLYEFLEIDRNFIPKQLAAYAPPPEEPKHPGRIKRFIKLIGRVIKKLHPPKIAGPLVPPAPDRGRYFNEKELALFKRTFAADARQLSHLLHRDMVVEWNLEVTEHETVG